MRLEFASICDAATARDGLLNVLAGGVTSVTVPAVPSSIGVVLAVMVEMQDEDADRDHSVQAVLRRGDTTLAGVKLDWKAEDTQRNGDWDASLPVRVPLVLPIDAFVAPAAGVYDLVLLLDDQQCWASPLKVITPG